MSSKQQDTAAAATTPIRETKLKQIGSTIISVLVTGCTRCGAQHSSRWHVERLTFVMCGYDRQQISIPLCDDCKRGNTTKPATAELFAKEGTHAV